MLSKSTIFRFIGLLLLLLLMLNFAGCNQEVAERDTVIRDDVLYLKGEEEPFTGFVVGKSREGYRSQTCTFKKEYKDGVLDGITSFWYPNGKLESKVPYKNGKVHGYYVRYWDNGRPRARIHFDQGLRGGSKGEMFWDKEGSKVKS